MHVASCKHDSFLLNRFFVGLARTIYYIYVYIYLWCIHGILAGKLPNIRCMYRALDNPTFCLPEPQLKQERLSVSGRHSQGSYDLTSQLPAVPHSHGPWHLLPEHTCRRGERLWNGRERGTHITFDSRSGQANFLARNNTCDHCC
jgi:hypothetical protein